MRRLLGHGGVATGFDEIVRGEHVCLLFDEEFADRQRKLMIEGLFVGLLGFILALFGGFEQAVIAGAELCFEISPGAMNGAGHGT